MIGFTELLVLVALFALFILPLIVLVVVVLIRGATKPEPPTSKSGE